MKIFTVFLGYLAVAAHFDHTVLASPADLVARREGGIMQQHNDTLMNQDSRQILETRQGDPQPFNTSVYMVVLDVAYSVIQENPTMGINELMRAFAQKAVDICGQTWKTWNWAVVDSEFQVVSAYWGITRYEFRYSNGTRWFNVIWLQDGLITNWASPYISAYSTNVVSKEIVTYDGNVNWQIVQFYQPSPGEVPATGIRADVEAVIIIVGNDVAASASQLYITQPNVFTHWVVGNCSQKWPDYNWAVDSSYGLMPYGVDGTDWGEIAYSLVPGGDEDILRHLQSSYDYKVVWLKSGMFTHIPNTLYPWHAIGAVLNHNKQSEYYFILYGEQGSADILELP